MTKIQQELEICAQLEQHRYVLHELLKEKQMLYTALNNTNPNPPPPQPPSNADILPYPKYNEQKYYAQNKVGNWPERLRAWAASSGFIALACCGSVIGIIFAPFVAILALIFLLLCLIITPISKRRAARKAYIEDCERIDRFNRAARNSVEQYQKDYAEYEHKLQQYEARLKNVDLQKHMLDNAIDTAANTYETISTVLSNYCSKNASLRSYNNYIAIATINSYLKSGQCATLELAIEKFNTEKQRGRISPNIGYALANRSVTKESMSAVISSLDEARSICARLRKDSISYFARVLEDDSPQSQSSPIDIYCNKILEQSHSI